MTDTPATPFTAARALHPAVLREGGRVRAAEVGAEDGSALQRLVELGLPVPQLVDGSYSAMDPRAVDCAAGATGLGCAIRVLDRPFTRFLVFDPTVAVIPAAPDNTVVALVEAPRCRPTRSGSSNNSGSRRRLWIGLPRRPLRWSPPPTSRSVGCSPAASRSGRAADRTGLSERTVAGHIARLRELYDAETLFRSGRRMRGSRTGESGG